MHVRFTGDSADGAPTPGLSALPAHSRAGRTPVTSHGELSHIALTLFIERGFEETTVDDIAAEARIGRRTLFRYFSSKKELPWGDFASLLAGMRARLRAVDDDVPLIDALRAAVLDFNRFPDEEIPYHRGRMRLLLQVPSLFAYSSLKYAEWRAVLAEFVARRSGEDASALEAQTIAWACLGMCLSAYEQWIADDSADLLTLLNAAFDSAESVFGLHVATGEHTKHRE